MSASATEVGAMRVAAEVQPPALAELYREHSRTVARWCARLGGPSMDVDDAVQEVFLAAHRGLASFRDESKITTWLYGITANVLRMRRRQRKWSFLLGGSAKEVAGHLPSREDGPDRALEQRQASARLWSILEGMNEKYRTVLVLFEWEEMSGEQIAELTGAKASTVWVWLHRARAQFLERLETLERKERA